MSSAEDWEKRQKDFENAAAIANYVGEKANKTMWGNHISLGAAVAAVLFLQNPMFLMIAPPAILAYQCWTTRKQTQTLRDEFNAMASALGEDALYELRPLHEVMPTESKLSLKDLDHKKYPLRVWGGLAAAVLMPALAPLWIMADILADESQMNLRVKAKAFQIRDVLIERNNLGGGPQ